VRLERELPTVDQTLESIENIKTTLLLMSQADQLLRSAINDGMLLSKADPSSDLFRQFGQAYRAIELINTDRLKAIVQSKGWPTISTYGPEADKAAFLVAQHSDKDPDFQREALTVLEQTLPARNTNPENYALLFDRVAISSGKQQRYGSQGKCDGLVFKPDALEFPERIDQLRGAISNVGAHRKTTIEISDALLISAKALAVRRKITLRYLRAGDYPK
jgi:hypothetical protein